MFTPDLTTCPLVNLPAPPGLTSCHLVNLFGPPGRSETSRASGSHSGWAPLQLAPPASSPSPPASAPTSLATRELWGRPAWDLPVRAGETRARQEEGAGGGVLRSGRSGLRLRVGSAPACPTPFLCWHAPRLPVLRPSIHCRFVIDRQWNLALKMDPTGEAALQLGPVGLEPGDSLEYVRQGRSCAIGRVRAAARGQLGCPRRCACLRCPLPACAPHGRPATQCAPAHMLQDRCRSLRVLPAMHGLAPPGPAPRSLLHQRAAPCLATPCLSPTL